MSVLGNVVHTITGRGGESENPVVHDWEASEAAVFGFLGASGKVPEALVVAHPNVFEDRAEWRTYHLQTGALLWAGELTEPRIEAGVADLLGKGWGELLPEREVDDFYYMTRDFRLFQSMSNTAQAQQSWMAETIQAGISFTRMLNTAASSATSSARMRLEVPNARLFRFRFSLSAETTATKKARCSIFAAAGQVFQQDLPDSNPTVSHDVDLATNLAAVYGGPTYWIEVEVTNVATDWTAGMYVSLLEPQIWGIPDGEDLTDGALVREVAERIGVPVVVDEVGVSVLPYWPGTVAAGELLDRAMLLSGRLARFVDHGVGPVLHYGRWGGTTWTLADDRQPTRVMQADAYDRVIVVASQETGQEFSRTYQLIPSPLDQHHTYGPLELPERMVWAEGAIDGLLDHVLQVVSAPRYTGDGHWAEVEDENGDVRSAHLVHAGDVAFHPTSGARLKVATLRRTESGVQPTFGDELETVLARVRTREMRRIRQRR